MNTMRPSTIVLKWICIFLFVPFLIKAQNTDSSIDSLCDTGNHQLSTVFLEKQVFEAKNQNDRNIALLLKAYCYKHQKQFGMVAETLKRAYPQASNDSLRFLIGYESALGNYLNAEYSKAKLSLIQLKNHTNSAEYEKKALYLEILIAHELGKWDEAQAASLKIGSESQSFQDSLKNFYTEMAEIKLKDPAKAEKLSHFIPGSGQIYAGKIFRGITSMVIQTGLLGFAAYSFLNGYYFSGTFTGVSLFYVFYMGGARHAEYLAQEYNKDKIGTVKNKIESSLFDYIKKGDAF
ncbi:hypothetical protein JKA74_17325 [Marivirga sp. S37H4]|uniref:Tetratricopeptide repeat protein n=1 Tax=Marivirga aurantiaca TaxID=2802615 RepID=A0A934X0R3_9BACT|nr:hypothetical protein [Marivirga aurantiaca]MBK6266808.1 hypothetical protein [Marivirga aurantiaca]